MDKGAQKGEVPGTVVDSRFPLHVISETTVSKGEVPVWGTKRYRDSPWFVVALDPSPLFSANSPYARASV